jgi:hypothetical protein
MDRTARPLSLQETSSRSQRTWRGTGPVTDMFHSYIVPDSGAAVPPNAGITADSPWRVTGPDDRDLWRCTDGRLSLQHVLVRTTRFWRVEAR